MGDAISKVIASERSERGDLQLTRRLRRHPWLAMTGSHSHREGGTTDAIFFDVSGDCFTVPGPQ